MILTATALVAINTALLNLTTLEPGISTSPDIYFTHSATLPSIYLNPYMYIRPALIWMNAVLSIEFTYCLEIYDEMFDMLRFDGIIS